METSTPHRDPRPKRGGRKRDTSRDASILDAALQILAEVGYERMTIDMVVERARAGKATVYRRGSSKAAMVLDAVEQMKRDKVDLGALRDTGSLRGDLLALARPLSVEDTAAKLRVIAGLASLLAHEPELASAAGDAIAAPWIEANRTLIERAVARGEIAADMPIDTLAAIIPSLGAHRQLIRRQPVDRDFIAQMLDDVVLPALGIRRPAEPEVSRAAKTAPASDRR